MSERLQSYPVGRPAGQSPAGRAHGASLVIPRGIGIVGMVRDADRLEIEGTILSPFVTARTLVIALGGTYTGEIEVDEAEIHGTMDGSILVRRSLVVRATGRILGVARCGRLRVEDGGYINAKLEMVSRP